MKINPMSPEEMQDQYSMDSEPRYPCGTSISLSGDIAVGAGYDKFKAGDYVVVTGVALVTRKSETADADDAMEGEDAEKHLGLQLTEINLKKTKVDRVKLLYGNTKKD